MNHKKKLLLALVLILLSGSAEAVLNISGNVVQDSITMLEWLVMSQTTNKSPDKINAGYYGLQADGWRLATAGEVQTLLINAGFKEPFNSSSNFDAANHLMALFGNTGVYDGEHGHQLSILAFSGTPGTSSGTLYSPAVFVGYGPWGLIGTANFPGSTIQSNIESPTNGNWLVRQNLTIRSPVFASNSGKLTNRYLSPNIGDKITFRSYGLSDTIYAYLEAYKYEVIDQVKCLKIKFYLSVDSGYIIYWLAQDTSGNIWILQFQESELSSPVYYGKNYAKIFMPSTPNIGSVLWDSEGMETVVELGVTVPTLSTGLGPFYNCIKTKLLYPDGDIDYLYYAPGVGQVKEQFDDYESLNGIELYEYKNTHDTMSWLLPLLLDD